jgi:hypothetical protein
MFSETTLKAYVYPPEMRDVALFSTRRYKFWVSARS